MVMRKTLGRDGISDSGLRAVLAPAAKWQQRKAKKIRIASSVSRSALLPFKPRLNFGEGVVSNALEVHLENVDRLLARSDAVTHLVPRTILILTILTAA
jgi:hypothetical protein